MMRFHEGIDYEKPILHYFENQQSVFVCLFPFLKEEIEPKSNMTEKFRVTISHFIGVCWDEVATDIGFNQLDRLALGVLGLQEPFTTELRDYCSQNELYLPEFDDDVIPDICLIPILKYFKSRGMNKLEMLPFERFFFNQTGSLDLSNVDATEAYGQCSQARYFRFGNEVRLLLPDHDCPYFLLIGALKQCNELIREAKLETFMVEDSTCFDWWNPKQRRNEC